MIFIIFSFLSQYTVSFSSDAEAIVGNPAGIGWHSGIEVIAENAESKSIFIKIAGLGFGYERGIWGMGSSYCFKSFLRAGSFYRFTQNGVWSRYGINVIPSRYISTGITISADSSVGWRAGIGIRPFKEFLTLFCDFLFPSKEFVYGGALHPYRGIWIYAVKKNHYLWGMEFHMGFSRLGIEYFNGAWITKVGLSIPFYESILPPTKKAVQIKIKKYDEYKVPGIFFFRRSQTSFSDFLIALENLSNREDVKAVIVRFESPPSLYQAEEIRRTIERLKKNKKKVYAYAYQYSLITYYIATACDKIYIHPYGEVFIHGLYLEKIFLKNVLNKLGIEAQFYRIGRYKSAVEPFTREGMSKEDSLQSYTFLCDVYQEIREKIKERITLKRFDSIINDRVFLSADEAKEIGLVDEVFSESQIDSFIKHKKLSLLTLRKAMDRRHRDIKWKDEIPRIAVLVLDGSIVKGEGGINPLLGLKSIGSDRIKRILRKLSKDKSIKAVVIRVNSPGGSAVASRIIWSYIRYLSKKKPVVVSMAGIAASGGYYISCAANKIVANNTTLTGSIGILGGKFVLKKLYDKLGISKQYVKLSPHADIFSDYRNFTAEEEKIFEKMLKKGYKTFVSDVSLSRNMDYNKVDSLGRGRIWSGKRAKEEGLVDINGGIIEAIEEAKKLAKIKDARIILMMPYGFWGMHSETFDLFSDVYFYLYPYEVIIKDM